MLVAIASLMVAAGTVTAGPNDVGEIKEVEVSGTNVYTNTGGQTTNLGITAGETVSVRVLFEANKTIQNVRMEAQIEGQKDDVEAKTGLFNVENGTTYTKTFLMEIPYELQDDKSGNATLDLEMWNDNYRTELGNPIELKVQRPSYTANIVSIESPQNARAGEVYPVDVVLKNRGYNDLDEVMVTVSVPKLGIQRTSYFGDLSSIGSVKNEDDEEDDTEKGRFFLEIPSDAKKGQYTVNVKASNDETSASDSKQFNVQNEFSSGNVFVDSLKKTASGGSANFEVSVANPTNRLRVFRVVSQPQGDVSVSPSTQIVSVPGGMSKSVQISAKPQSEGEQKFDVNVLAGEDLVGSKTLTVAQGGDSSSDSGSGSVIALTIILAVIFLVLLGILIVILRKKPAETEEFGESYY